MKKIFKNIACFFLAHDWTSKSLQGIKPEGEELKSITGFKSYSEMYCLRCGKKSKLNDLLFKDK